MDEDEFQQELERRYRSMVRNLNGFKFARDSGALKVLAEMTGSASD